MKRGTVLLEEHAAECRNSAVPISLDLDEAHQVLIVSGPNAGGKTVVLKTVGLIMLMAQMGIPVRPRRRPFPYTTRCSRISEISSPLRQICRRLPPTCATSPLWRQR